MKISILSTSDGSAGGSAAAYRLHKGLNKIGLNSTMLVQSKETNDCSVISSSNKIGEKLSIVKPILDSFPLRVFPKKEKKVYSLQWLPNDIKRKLRDTSPDIINLHWICGGFVPIESLNKLSQPIVWTLHDMWGFTGGCHYSGNCQGYLKSCGACPQLGSNRQCDLSRWTWKRKANAWKNLNLTIVTPSQWLADCARNSSLFRNRSIEVIPNGLDMKVYKPIDKKLARDVLNLPQDKQLILFGAMSATSDHRKGFHFLLPALEKLIHFQGSKNIELVIFGASKQVNPPNLNFKINYLGQLNDDISMVMAYSASDVFIAPSVEDNLPNTVMESISCGTPTVAFQIGGMPDMINHQQNGYLAQPFDIDDLTNGLHWVLEDGERRKKLCENSRNKAIENFGIEIVAQKYSELYQNTFECVINEGTRQEHSS
jgi:glycosyltransferase involved in cell wall biosynthesis